jgi:hypothetical protein
LALQSLTLDVARADKAAKRAYEEEFLKVVEIFATGFTSGNLPARLQSALAILSLL